MKDLFTTTQCLSSQQIQDYLAEKLDEDNRFAVENHLLDCELCSAAVEGFAASYDFEKDQNLEQLAERFPYSEAARAAQTQALRNSYRWLNRIAAAAAILLLPLAAWLYWNSQADDRLYLHYFESYQSDYLSVRGKADNAPPLLKQAMANYQQKEYLRSLPLFESYLEEIPENTIAIFHAGLASLEAGQTTKAIQYLEIVRINDNDYYEDASWYLALAYLKLDRKAEAQGILDDLSKIPNGYYNQQVKDLQEGLQ